jgi:alkylation response protein AidB-like acyl-CoA dehydrogenase
MNFGFTEEQDLLRQEVRKFLDQKCPLDQVRKLMETETGFCRDQWKQLGELGWLGLTIPEDLGGAGLGWVDLTVVLEEMGRTLYPSPFLATTLAAAALREGGSPEQQRRWLPEIAAGSRIASLAVLEASDLPEPAGVGLLGRREGRGFTLHGEKLQVLDAAAADLLVVAFRPEGGAPTLAVVEVGAPGVRAEAQASIDLTRRVGQVRFDGAAVPDDAILPGGEVALPRTLDRAAAAVTAEMIGAAEGALALTVGYAKQRVQFGSPIGRFQGVKHPLAEMYVDVESFKSLLYYAAWTLDEGQADAPRAVSLAKAYASEAFARIGVDCVQLHGGIGYTWEYDAQLYLKRSKWARPAFGGPGYHYDRVVRLGGGA